MRASEAATLAALAALESRLGLPVARNPSVMTDPARFPSCVLRDGTPELDDAPTLSPCTYPWAHELDLELHVQDRTPAEIDAAIDDWVEAVEAALADRRLGGAVDWLEVSPPRRDSADAMGTAPTVAAIVTVTLYYTSDQPSG